jgi:NAD(P)-dependent dehydrogenase (short-subunit alcohol dehydrogenase family)
MLTQNVVVTGGSSGIGAAIAAIAAGQGATVTIVDYREPETAGYAFVQTDLADPASIDKAIEQLPEVIRTHYNVAGIPGTHPDENVLKVNFLGLRKLTESLVPRIPSGGSIVNVASVAGIGYTGRMDVIHELIKTPDFDAGLEWFRKNTPEGATYNFTKEVLIVYTSVLSARSGAAGIRVNSVSPGPVRTRILADFEESMGKDALDLVQGIVGRHAEPDDIAPVATFLASDEARWVNGNNIWVDGGAVNALMSG